MRFLDGILGKIPEFKMLERAIADNKLPAAATGLSSVHKAHTIYTLCRKQNCGSFVLVSDEAEARRLSEDLTAMGLKTLIYPAKDCYFRDVEGQSHEYEHKRLQVLYALQNKGCDVVIACIDAALQYTMPPEKLKQNTIELKEEAETAPQKIVDILIAGGYERTEQVEGTGQFAVRGGILDVFVPAQEQPCRVEFWGDLMDTVSYFDIETQRRTERCLSCLITPAVEILAENIGTLCEKIRQKAQVLKSKNAEKAITLLLNEADSMEATGRLKCADKYYTMIYDKPSCLLSYIPKDFLVFVSEQTKVRERMKAVQGQWNEDVKLYLEEGVLCKGLGDCSFDYTDMLTFLSKSRTVFLDNFARGGSELPLRELVNLSVRQLSAWSGSVSILKEDLAVLSPDMTCVILAGTEKAADNLIKDLTESGYSVHRLKNNDYIEDTGLYVAEGSLSSGFEYPSTKFMLITHGLVSVAPTRRKIQNKNSKHIFSLSELSVGDYVVHSANGIGVFEGIHKMDMHGVVKDYIKIRYAKGDMLYVPVTQLDLVAKYIGPNDKENLKLHRLGGTEWQKTKQRVRKAVKDIAQELIKMYAERMKVQGYAFSEDMEWQRDFEARFEYEETTDQKRSIAEIKNDMEKNAPMDRLLCGDVGFGKTEVALRAAFKCIADSKQCAILVPTTILAWQHYQTALRRFEGFPVQIELLSRFRTPSQQTEIISKIKRGEIDLVIGTHRLVSKDVEFKDLGLLIVDEEQRFGVAQKERFKEQYKNIDILTLSATPIPRTLNMAMSGIRDMSTLDEAPQDRHPVQTYVLEHDDSVIAEAIRRELRRGGQVFYLYNTVEGIEHKAMQLQEEIPEAKIGVGHGRMSESQLSEVWRKMIEQEINILVSTTIIETGVDIPNANTLIIENADRMGLSQLHQIRGRVGRSSRRAYAYLTFQRNKVLTDISQKRLEAIREFTEFGSGFKIAMRDLELRGAGNILGAEQHGHMEDVGYELYMKLLNEAVEEEKGKKHTAGDTDCLVDIRMEAHIPEDYISNLNTRLGVYRRIADIRSREDAEDVIDELIDRFGDMPKSVQGLIDIALIRNKAQQMGIYEIRENPNHLMLFVTQIKSEAVASVLGHFKGRSFLNAGSKPYIAIKTTTDENIFTLLNEIFSEPKV